MSFLVSVFEFLDTGRDLRMEFTNVLAAIATLDLKTPLGTERGVEDMEGVLE
jgi:hypothetical protein